MEIKTLPIDSINPAVYNPRRDLQPGDSDYEKLKKSIVAFDMVEIDEHYCDVIIQRWQNFAGKQVVKLDG